MNSNPHAPAILVADDNDQIRALVAEILRERGYRVFEAATGEEALATCSEGLALVVADIVMPPDGGLAIVDALRERVAGLKVLFISGYGALHHGADDIDPVLSKPFTADELLSRVIELAPAARER
jgi:two-component system, cell cycle sensor histidine kinase and response regulator CckA